MKIKWFNLGMAVGITSVCESAIAYRIYEHDWFLVITGLIISIYAIFCVYKYDCFK
jgi:hypothetical protein